VRIYDVQGRLVRQLAKGQIGSGLQESRWDGRNDDGVSVGSGVYLYRVEVGHERFNGKMVLVK
jgi:flagellar hook assembly protein FlgD